MKQFNLFKICIGILTAYGILTWTNSQTSQLLLSILVTALWCVAYFFITKQINVKNKSNLNLIVFLITLISVSYFNFTIERPLPFLTQSYSLSFVASEGPVQISQMNVNHQNLDLSTLTTDNDWIFKETLASSNGTPLTLSNLKNELIDIQLLKTSGAGTLSIYRNDHLVKTIHLNSTTENDLKIKVSPDYPILLNLAYMGSLMAFYLILSYPVAFAGKLTQRFNVEALSPEIIGYAALPILLITLFKWTGLANVSYRPLLLMIFFISITGSEIGLFKKVKMKHNDSFIKWIRIFFYLILTSILTILVMQIIYFFPNFDITMTWIAHHINLIFLASTIVFSISLALYCLFNHLILAISLSNLLLIVVGIANYYKMLVVGEPIYPSDMSMLSQMDEIVGYVKEILSPALIGGLMAFIIGLAILSVFTRKGTKLTLKSRVIGLVLALFYLASTFYYDKTFMNPIVTKTVNFSKWNQLSNYQQNGFLFGFITNLQNDLMIKNENYSEANMQQITDYYTEKAKEYNQNLTNTQTPNVMVIVSESLSDPTVFNQLTFSEDPLPNLRQYMQTYSSGNMLSPFKGNRTANIEFEFLLGFTNSLLLEGTVPFQQALSQKTEIPSIVSYFDDLGYSSIAIHPNNAAFYKRSLVYPALGFDEFMSIDKMTAPEYIDSGKYVTDEYVFNQMYDHLLNTEGPTFTYGLTMQNHIPIFDEKFGPTSITVTDSSLVENKEMETYAEGLKETDTALKDFITKIENYDEPTVVVFFGDHLVNFSSDIHAAHGYVDKDPNAQTAKLFYETPLLIMSNIQDFNIENIYDVSPIFIAPLILKELNLPLTPFQMFLSDLYEEFSVLHNNFKMDANQNQVNELTAKQQQLLLTFELIQYDILEGSEDLLPTFFNVPE
ncbi:LTA synthase family protein [Turicibacter sanguinis]|uniref:LTA synthase family protein n=1 Tax=Turicibacter sanguinis TaxID=154288 RepID=UPI0039926D41